MNKNYKDALEKFNCLQSNEAFLKLITKYTLERKLLKVSVYLERCGITTKDIESLSIIHITGTKGKGSTSMYCESILRHHGFKTGLFTSPHIVKLEERIRINGMPLKESEFAKYFWIIYNALDRQKSDASDFPYHFNFLMIMAFYTFLNENVDVAIFEVGIGGEYDCTNIIQKVPVVGISSLGIDHTQILGETIEKIAWHKGGIMKVGCKAFTVPQLKSALQVLIERSIEKQIVQPSINLPVGTDAVSSKILNLNANLALTLANAWMKSKGLPAVNDGMNVSENVRSAIKNCNLPGRYQVIQTEQIRYYIDGAHTLESISLCKEWFLKQESTTKNKKILVFNITGKRDSQQFLRILCKCNFNCVLFVPNIAKEEQDNGINNYTDNSIQLQKCKDHYNIYLKLIETGETNTSIANVHIFSCVESTIKKIQTEGDCSVLITGSLYLVGISLSIIETS